MPLDANSQAGAEPDMHIDDLAPEESEVLRAFTAEPRTHIDVLARSTGLASSRMSGILLALELKGLVRQWPGMYYSRNGS